MLVEWLTALQDLPFVVELRNSRWSYAVVNASHIVGIALLFGAIVPLDLRLIGLLAVGLDPRAGAGSGSGRGRGPRACDLSPGALLFSIRAVQYAGTTLFQVKLALIACGVANALLLRHGRAMGSCGGGHGCRTTTAAATRRRAHCRSACGSR